MKFCYTLFLYIVMLVEKCNKLDEYLICYNLKAKNIYIFTINQNQNFITKLFIIFKH